MTNVRNSRHTFEFDAAEQVRVWHDTEDAGKQILVIVHSHTVCDAVPSSRDIEIGAKTQDFLHLIVSLFPHKTAEPELRLWRYDEETQTASEVEFMTDVREPV